MAGTLIKNHPAIGSKGIYSDNKKHKEPITVTIIAVRRPLGFLLNIETMQEMPNVKLVELKLQPTDGSKPFWSRAMKDNTDAAPISV